MSDVTTEQKLQLAKQIRSKHNENCYDMYNRERILYGQATQHSHYVEEPELSAVPSSFGLRFLLALVLVAIVIIMDVNEMDFYGITSEKIIEVISVNYEDEIDEWINSL